jgi:Skp family chaperone for outer membrane proteins
LKIIHRTLTLVFLAMAPAAGTARAQPAPQTPPGPQSTKIGVVNLAVLYRDQDSVKRFMAEMKPQTKPYEDKNKELDDLIASWTKALCDPKGKLTDEERRKGFEVIVECRRRMQKLEEEYDKGPGAIIAAESAALEKAVKNAVKLYADANGFQLVLGYGEPETPLPPLKDYVRRMSIVEAGHLGMMPLAGFNQQDITRGVLDLLNTSYRAGSAARPK